MRLTITWGDKTRSIDVEESSTLLDLKRSIASVTGIPAASQNIMGIESELASADFSGSIPLEALGLRDGSQLLIIDERGADAKPTAGNAAPAPAQTVTFTPSSFFPNAPNNAMNFHHTGYDGPTFNMPQHNPAPSFNGYTPLPSTGPLTPSDLVRAFDFCQTEDEVFTAIFESEYAANHPNFIGGSFARVLDKWRSKNSFGIVNIHQDVLSNRDFNNLLLSRPELAQFSSKNSLQWWVGVLDDDAKKQLIQSGLGHAIEEFKSPYVAIVVPSLEGRMQVVSKITSLMTISEFIAQLLNAMDEASSILSSQRVKMNEREQQRMLVQQQDQEFAAAAKQDAIRQNEQHEKERAAEQEILMKSAQLKTAHDAALKKANELPAEPPANTPHVKLAFRLLDGARAERRFLASQPLRHVFDFLGGVMAVKTSVDAFVDEADPALPFRIENYEVVQNFPRKAFSLVDASRSLQELQIAHNSALFLQRKS